ncbi:SGNH/GDSL hydrolase family protein [Mucilaginibacter sp. 21P]|uniref:SGNH/GDSL hydrolase family protein n=1 Tax=Mucilaginibacter sp. 21P TaxID=2778902 RepID=UPI001C57BFAC|nr:SGNH/GDSL hydrolase family protein [Mucilaginibacter sp. 21P]
MRGYLTLVLLFATACTKQAVTAYPTPGNASSIDNNMPQPKTFTYLALGDSYTIGEAVPQEQSFPYQLIRKFENNISPEIIAVTGWTTGELKQGIQQRNLQKHDYDLVTLLIGVNNQYRHYSKDDYRKEFTELLATAISYAGGNKQHVIVLSIPDWGVTPFGKNTGNSAAITTDIDLFNGINREETDKAGVAYVNITQISRQANSQPDLVATDGLHPSGRMYGLWVDQLVPVVTKQLAL